MSAKYHHTEKITQRRKALFPSDSSALGGVSPEHSSDSNFSDIQALDDLEAELNDATEQQHFFKNNLTDYIILNKNSADDDYYKKENRLLGLIERKSDLFKSSENRLGKNKLFNCNNEDKDGKRNKLFSKDNKSSNKEDKNKNNKDEANFKENVFISNKHSENIRLNVTEHNLLNSNKFKENDLFNPKINEENRLKQTELNSFTPTTRLSHSDSNMSPLYLSPMHSLITSPILYSPRITRALTPLGRSPTSSLKTPNDNTVKVNAKNQKRKMDTSVTEPESGKLSPVAKNMKMDPLPTANKSKVRTALFTDMVVPTSTFYPKNVVKRERHVPVATYPVKVAKRKPSEVYLCGKRRSRRRNGQINAGVMHKIKKPKQKKATKAKLMRAALNILDNSPLNEYLKDLTLLNSAGTFNRIKKIEPLNDNKNGLSVNENDKEDKENMTNNEQNIINNENLNNKKRTLSNLWNLGKQNLSSYLSDDTMEIGGSEDEDNNCKKKFFKSKTRKGVVKIIENIQINVNNGKYELLERKNDNQPTTVIDTVLQTSLNDFNMSAGSEGNLNITNILDMLDDGSENSASVSNNMVQDERMIDSTTINAEDMTSSDIVTSESNLYNELNSMTAENIIPIDENCYSTVENFINITPNNTTVLNPEVLGILNDFNDESNDVNVTIVESTVGFYSPNLNVNKTILETSIERDLILSPTSQMCNMASGLALNSPKKAILNINSLLDDVEKHADNSVTVEMDSEKKLFPIFYNSGGSKEVSEKVVESEAKRDKKWKSIPSDQYLLDAGQKKFGLTQCHECGAMYHAGDPNEEISHQEYHNSTNVLKFVGWKNERVVGNFDGGRVLKIVPNDSKSWWKKVNELTVIINRDLGFYEVDLPIDRYQVYLYIQNKQIVGCLMAEPKSVAYKMLESGDIDLCSEESYPVKCGVSRLWVAPKFRKKNIATSMMQVLRLNFVQGYVLSKQDLAMSSPTEMGKLFAKKYFSTDNFFIYLS